LENKTGTAGFVAAFDLAVLGQFLQELKELFKSISNNKGRLNQPNVPFVAFASGKHNRFLVHIQSDVHAGLSSGVGDGLQFGSTFG
jgi:hypothetical protein